MVSNSCGQESQYFNDLKHQCSSMLSMRSCLIVEQRASSFGRVFATGQDTFNVTLHATGRKRSQGCGCHVDRVGLCRYAHFDGVLRSVCTQREGLIGKPALSHPIAMVISVARTSVWKVRLYVGHCSLHTFLPSETVSAYGG
eukprot:5125985-Amphidinium_carterae.1